MKDLSTFIEEWNQFKIKWAFIEYVACFSVCINYIRKTINIYLDFMMVFRSSILIPGWWDAPMEFHWFHALVHDRVSCVMRRMDRINVGLYVSWWRIMHPIFPSHRCHWQFSRKYSKLIWKKKTYHSWPFPTNKILSFNKIRFLIFSWPCFWVILVHRVYLRQLPIRIQIK